MTGRSIYWHDGMFMWPHHMQLEERFRAGELALQNRWNVHYHWGLRAIDIDPEPLKNHRLVIRRLQARMRDGTMIATPEDGPLPAIDLQEGLAKQDRVTVNLAVPLLKANQANIPVTPPAGAAPATAPKQETRFVVGKVNFEDENSGLDAVDLEVRNLNLRLLLDTQDLAGFEVLPILRVEKSPGNAAQVQLDITYIPPLLACDAWEPLSERILKDLHHRFGSRIQKLADQMINRGISFDARNPGDQMLLGQLAVLNEAYTTLNALAFAEGVHPLQAYVELCRIVGQLAIYYQNRRVGDLPRYNHDELGFCFYRALQQLEAIELKEVEYQDRKFVGENLRMQVALESRWLEPIWQMFVGVESNLKPEEVVRLLTKPGQLNAKIGSADRVDFIYERGLPGLEFKPADRLPRDLPVTPNLTYFQINRESRKEEWQKIQQSLTLAIRFNQNRVVVNAQGTIQGQTEVAIKTGTATATNTTTTTNLQFSLFLTPQQA